MDVANNIIQYQLDLESQSAIKIRQATTHLCNLYLACAKAKDYKGMDSIFTTLKSGNENLACAIMRQKYIELATKSDVDAMSSIPVDMLDCRTMGAVYRASLLRKRYKAALAVPVHCHVLARREEGLECVYDALIEFRELRVFYRGLGKKEYPELKNCARYYNEKNAIFDYYFIKFFRSIFSPDLVADALLVNKKLQKIQEDLKDEAFLRKLDNFLGNNAPAPGVRGILFGIGYNAMAKKILESERSRVLVLSTEKESDYTYTISSKRGDFLPVSPCIMR